MKISVVGTGYVGLVTGVALSEIGHMVICIDVDIEKVTKMQAGICPIYEPGLEEMMKKNIMDDRLTFTNDHKQGFKDAEIIYIAVGTPQNPDGTANLSYIEMAANEIAKYIKSNVIVVTKSTVPVGTNDYIKKIISSKTDKNFYVVSNPEFLREGSAVYDTFHGDRTVIGSESEYAAQVIDKVNRPFGIPIIKTDLRSAEMIKYASNAFLATKISFINEIANICEKLGANVEEVAYGMGQDKRIGDKFLNAGIGYGGSCFPKDTNALVQIAGNVKHQFNLLQSVIEVNNYQQKILVHKARERCGSLKGKTVAMLGLAFKPNTDDMREAASIVVAQELVLAGANVVAYDPIAIGTAKHYLPQAVNYVKTIEQALDGADMAFILTEWDEIKSIDLLNYKKLLKDPLVFDGRNCYSLTEVKKAGLEYHSIGRPVVLRQAVVV